MSLSSSLFMRAIRREPVPRAPVWIMRQAGRYLPEYRQTRAQAGDFLNLCRNKELACEVVMQPLRRFDLDAAILFSDILTIPDAMGLGLKFLPDHGPSFANPINSAADVAALPNICIEDDLGYVMDAVELIRQEMPQELPLLGFAGSPWTLACYMIEGGSSKDFKKTVNFMYCQTNALQNLLSKLAHATTQYLAAQIRAGANAVMLFDTWGGILSTYNYQTFSLSYMQEIVTNLQAQHPDVPVIVFTKGGGQWLSAIADTGCDVVGLDWTVDIARAKAEVGQRVALQGNLDPQVLLTDAATIKREVQRILSSYAADSGLIFNLGHGITPDVAPDNVQIMLDAVHEFYA